MHIHQPVEFIEDANEALQMLKEGNERFLKNDLIKKDSYHVDRELLCSCQKPFAVILTCSDSRVAPEIFFDQKLGDIFIVRNAGNIVDVTALGSIEYAIVKLKCKLVVVCGHSSCGAVSAACKSEDYPPNIKVLIDHIKPAVEKGGDLKQITINNIELMVEEIKADNIARHSGVMVVGAFYDLQSGEVSWL